MNEAVAVGVRQAEKSGMSKSKPVTALFNVGVFLDLSTGAGRAMMEGIARHLVTRRNWSLCLNPLAKDGTVPFCVKQWPGHGVIAQVLTASDARLLRQLDMPIVDVGGTVTHKWPRVGPDEQAIARLAIEHLRLHGAQHFAFASYAASPTPAERHSAYVQELKRLGIDCATHEMAAASPSLTPAAKGRANAQSIRKLEKWLRSLPQPCGILAANDVMAQLVTKSCRAIDIACPDDVMVLGVDNDVPLCVLSDPPLSSIEAGWEQIGYEAAALLTAMLEQRKAAPKQHAVLPQAIIPRRSTDRALVADALVIKAIRHIAEQGCKAIDAAGIARHLGVSKRTLERRFQATHTRSIGEEIDHVRLRHAENLLRQSHLPIKAIARAVGHQSLAQFTRFFQRTSGLAPGAWRVKHGR